MPLDVTGPIESAIKIVKGITTPIPIVETPNVETTTTDVTGPIESAIKIVKGITTPIPIVETPNVETTTTDAIGLLKSAIEIAKGINTKKQTDDKVDTNIQKTSSEIIIPTTDMIETAIHIIKNITDTIKPVAEEKTLESIKMDSTGLVDSAVNILSHVNVSQIVDSLSSIEKPTINITGLLENAVEIINRMNTTPTTSNIVNTRIESNVVNPTIKSKLVNTTIETSGIIDTAIEILSNENISPGSLNGISNVPDVNNSSYGEPSYLYTVNANGDKITDVSILKDKGNENIEQSDILYNFVIDQFRAKKRIENVGNGDKQVDIKNETKNNN